MYYVPVVNQNQEPLMPTTRGRAIKWILSGKATPFYKKGILCVRLNVEPSNNQKQDICVGLDPGSKREAYTVKSKAHTYINILTETPDWVKDAVKQRRIMRRARRQRNTRYRPARFNNRKGAFLPPLKQRSPLDHKINGNRQDNRIENLELVSNSSHIKKHLCSC